ncbi:hypothetical protein AgCh_018884 [Apium graveolens]
MSTAPRNNPSLCSSPPLPRSRTSLTNKHSSLVTLSTNNAQVKNHGISTKQAQLARACVWRVKALDEKQTAESSDSKEEGKEEYEEYEVEIVQPYGLKFVKGRDGGTYIDAIAPGGFADQTKMFAVGDKVIATSAVFGTEMWPAAEYGRTMYTIRQRIGPLLMKMQKRNGKVETGGEPTEREIIRAERNSGVVSDKVREIQMQNYIRKKEQKEQRERELREGLQLYKIGKYEEALEKFESVLGSKPESNEASVASYNVACCYSKLNQVLLDFHVKGTYRKRKRVDLLNIIIKYIDH